MVKKKLKIEIRGFGQHSSGLFGRVSSRFAETRFAETRFAEIRFAETRFAEIRV